MKRNLFAAAGNYPNRNLGSGELSDFAARSEKLIKCWAIYMPRNTLVDLIKMRLKMRLKNAEDEI